MNCIKFLQKNQSGKSITTEKKLLDSRFVNLHSTFQVYTFSLPDGIKFKVFEFALKTFDDLDFNIEEMTNACQLYLNNKRNIPGSTYTSHKHHFKFCKPESTIRIYGDASHNEIHRIVK